MQALERYLTLYRRFANGKGVGIPSEASLDEVAEALFCTTRNAKLVIRKLAEDGLVAWQAGRGRGHRSLMTFLADKEELLLDISSRYAEAGEYNKAIHVLRFYGEGTAASEKFMERISGSFGFRKEREEGGDVLRLPIYKPIITLDPAEYLYALSSHLIRQLFDRLVEYDEKTGRLLPGIAHDWERNEDATEWTFYLRKGIAFHDGSGLTAADVAFTAERLRSGGKRNGWFIRSLRLAEALSERTVRFHLDKPNWLFVQFASSNAMSILPAGLAGQSEDRFWKRPVGTGPFQAEEWTDERLILKANPSYYQVRPHLDRVEIVHVPREDALTAVVAGLSWQQLICDPARRDVTAENGWVQIESGSICTSMLSWNMRRKGPQRSHGFRRAVDRLIDRSAMIRELGGSRDFPANRFFPDPAAERVPDAVRPEREEIRRLLHEAGYDGTAITLCTTAGHAEDADWIRKRLADMGIETSVRIGGTDSIHGVLHEADLVLQAHVFPEGEVSLIESCVQDGSFLKELMDPELSAWIAERFVAALGCEERQERMNVYSGIEARLREELQVLFLFHMKFYTDYHPSLKGVRINSLGWIDFKDIWRA